MTLTTNQVAEAIQVSLRQLQWWHERRIVNPAIDGHTRAWSKGDVFNALLVARLRSKRVSLQRIRKLLASLPLEKVQAQEDAVIIVRRRGVRICTEDAALRALDLESGAVAVVMIAPLLEMLSREERRHRVQ